MNGTSRQVVRGAQRATAPFRWGTGLQAVAARPAQDPPGAAAPKAHLADAVSSGAE